MVIIRSIAKMQQASLKLKRAGRSVGFVPTMGALHRGHLTLIRRARRENKAVVVSIFVNPAQFSPREDYGKYPRTFLNDLRLCRKENVDIVFAPAVQEVYPAGYRTYITVEGLSEVLCGKFRPGHFRGVATVVAKLFNIVGPRVAYFGQKDAQQAAIIKKMVADLNIPVGIKVMPTVREPDGLALSSRNVYLSSRQRDQARVLWQALQMARRMIKSRQVKSSKIISAMRKLIRSKKDARIDYISLVDMRDLLPVKSVRGSCLIALAARFGSTRLIDNLVVRN